MQWHARANQTRGIIMGQHQRSQASMRARSWCGKVAYPTKKGAKRALRMHRDQSQRVYRCPLCKAWHLTSQPARAAS